MVEITEAKKDVLGGVPIKRALPLRQRRTVGPWCFADHMGPADVDEKRAMNVGPHPHIGLQTVTWLLDGQMLHRDSLGSEQVLRPGQLNLMTAGGGVSHSEESTGQYRGTLEGIQLWVAQPEATRHGDNDFEHIGDPAQGMVGEAEATIIVGEFAGLTSNARRDTDHMGVDLSLRTPTTVPLRPDYEYSLIVLRGAASVDGDHVVPGQMAYLDPGHDEMLIDVREPSRVILIGGEPFESPIVMWWNYVGRSKEEISEAHRSWQQIDGRFGDVDSLLPRYEFPSPPWER